VREAPARNPHRAQVPPFLDRGCRGCRGAGCARWTSSSSALTAVPRLSHRRMVLIRHELLVDLTPALHATS